MSLVLNKNGCEILIDFFKNEMIKYKSILNKLENTSPMTPETEEEIKEVLHTLTYIDMKTKEFQSELKSL